MIDAEFKHVKVLPEAEDNKRRDPYGTPGEVVKGMELRNFRTALALTVPELAEFIGRAQRSVTRWEGETAPTKIIDDLTLIAHLNESIMDYLAGPGVTVTVRERGWRKISAETLTLLTENGRVFEHPRYLSERWWRGRVYASKLLNPELTVTEL